VNRLLCFVWFLAASVAFAQDSKSEKKEKEVRIPAGVQHAQWDRLLKKHVDQRGLVNYAAWQRNPSDRAALDRYLTQYQRTGSAAAGNEKAASLANAYNAFTIRWILQNYPTESIWRTEEPFDVRRHRIGGELVSLSDIEKGTLIPAIGWKAHGVLVCAARSCPPLQRSAYNAGQFDAQVAAVYRIWLGRSDLNTFRPEQKRAEISSIFKWYKADYAKVGGPKPILKKYTPPTYRDFLTSADYEIKFKSYNWGLNDQDSRGRNYNRLNLYLDTLF